MAEVVAITKANDWVKPTVYQGGFNPHLTVCFWFHLRIPNLSLYLNTAMYNGITRAIESELVPCLRKNNIRLVTYNPLAGTPFFLLSMSN